MGVDSEGALALLLLQEFRLSSAEWTSSF